MPLALSGDLCQLGLQKYRKEENGVAVIPLPKENSRYDMLYMIFQGKQKSLLQS